MVASPTTKTLPNEVASWTAEVPVIREGVTFLRLDRLLDYILVLARQPKYLGLVLLLDIMDAGIAHPGKRDAFGIIHPPGVFLGMSLLVLS